MSGDGKSASELAGDLEADETPAEPGAAWPGYASSGEIPEFGFGAPADPPDDGSLIQRWLADTFGLNITSQTVPGVDANNMPIERRASTAIDMDGAGTVGGSLDTVLTSIASMSEAQISYLQRRLFQAGFYRSAVYDNASSIHWGMIDNATLDALNAAVDKAAINQVDNFDQFLENERHRFGLDGVAADGQTVTGAGGGTGGSGDRPVIDIVLSDPDAIRLTAESTAVELLGRKPTEAELAAITSSLHARQREYQTARQTPVGGAVPGGDGAALGGTATLMGGERDFTLPPGTGEVPGLDPEQLGVVNTIVQVGTQMGLSEEYIVGAISAGIVESGLRNLDFGDRDSLGVFQQRPSQGWGSPEQVTDVAYAARKFYEAMLRADGADLGELVANTQRPAEEFRGRYADVMDQAVDILAFATGRTADARVGAGPDATSIRQVERTTQPVTQPGRIGPDTASIRQAERRPSPRPLSVHGPADGPIPHDDLPDGAMWFDDVLGGSRLDPIYRESMAVDQNAHIEMALRNADPKAYETRQAALKAVEFFALLGAGGGMTRG